MDHGSFAVFCIVCFSVVGLSSSCIPVGLGPTVLFVSISQVIDCEDLTYSEMTYTPCRLQVIRLYSDSYPNLVNEHGLEIGNNFLVTVQVAGWCSG